MAIETGYCTNVHAGPDLEHTQANLLEHALAVKQQYSPTQPMGIGLWLASPAAAELQDEDACAAFRHWLDEHQLHPFTLNGFPFGNFHQEVVKKDVYLPTWMTAERRIYTEHLVQVLHQLLPEDSEGSISTLPVAWGTPRPSREELDHAADNLLAVADRLSQLEAETGRQISICLEPEPGCVLQRGEDVVSFFKEHLLPRGEEQRVRRYLRVCHDICHSAVMFESQTEVLQMLHAAGIRIGKVQVSAAVELRLGELDRDQRQQALAQLAGFDEHRYLHQTSTRKADGSVEFYEDLGEALRQAESTDSLDGTWCTHFHVPIYLAEFGHLHTTQDQIRECLAICKKDEQLGHFEVETYAWTVLPEQLQKATLADGIAEELNWFKQVIAEDD